MQADRNTREKERKSARTREKEREKEVDLKKKWNKGVLNIYGGRGEEGIFLIVFIEASSNGIRAGEKRKRFFFLSVKKKREKKHVSERRELKREMKRERVKLSKGEDLHPN